ncbi:hypothetical protein [uncultured Bacteroides sp.]|uniref:hypothetical protein n=1 Tax=uncultured Bacteroides sp. TaxID=162156 RepID=UPI002AAB1E97|nr:hypothetical protein [uncultured Bacteroides sp.]
MKTTIFSLLTLSLLFSACNNSDNFNEVLPETETSTPILPQAKVTYSVEDITYSIKDADGISFLTHTLPNITFANRTAKTLTTSYYDNDSEFPKRSEFTFEKNLPKEITDSLISIKTPTVLLNNKIYTNNVGWMLTSLQQTKPYSNTRTLQTINIPANQAITIIRSFDEEILQASFVLTLRNDVTNEIATYNGKWKGTLNYTHRSISLKQENVK